VRTHQTATEEETIALGEQIGAELSAPAVVLLIGNLGAGKTTLAKGIVRGITGISTDEVASPTFTLIHEYGEQPKVFHIDLYRLETREEAAALGLEDLFETGVCLVEWGERFRELMPARRTEIAIRVLPSEIRLIERTQL
jgi:tRNA threonylcarbamoyladenosine biosynthesis protein TsaE